MWLSSPQGSAISKGETKDSSRLRNDLPPDGAIRVVALDEVEESAA